jgi:NitT/TauT family transport system substrate-binding protein
VRRLSLRRRGGLAGAVLAATVLAVSGLVAGCGSTSDSGSSRSGPTWVHGIVTPKGDAGFILMAQERRYYQQQGVNVQIKPFVGNVQIVQALVSGAIDSAEVAPDPVYDASLKGANVKLIGSTLPGLTYALLSKSSISDFNQLEGKTIGVSAPGSLPDVVTRAMLGAKGLDPNKVHVVSAGDDAQRFQALIHGRIDAAAVSPEFVPQVKDNPSVHVLGTAQDTVPQYPRFMIAANGNSLKNKPDAAVRFLAAEMEGIGYAAAHRDAEIGLSAKTLHQPPTDPSLSYDYDAVMQSHAASPQAEIPMDKLQWLQSFRLGTGLQKQPVDFTKLVDNSYRQQALAKVPPSGGQ